MNNTFSHGHALLIGVGADLPVTVKDATAIHDVLLNPSRASYPLNQVELLTERNADRKNILKIFDRFINRVNNDPEATVIIYFSGHGVKVEKPEEPATYFLVPYGYQQNDLAGTAISGLELTNKIEAIRAQKLVVLLDCCHAGGLPTLKVSGGVTVKSWHVPPDLLHTLETGGGRVVIASSRENERSYILKDAPYSLFTTCLLETMAGKATTKKDGYVRILDILRYLFDNIPQRVSDLQHPFVNKILNLDDNFPLCYYAGGLKGLEGEPPDNTSSTKPLTNAQLERIKQRIKELEMSLALRSERMKRTQAALDIETEPLHIFKYEQQLLREKTALTPIKSELEDLESKIVVE